MLDLEQLLKPISEVAPCGEDMAFSTELDAIARARQSDDPSLEQGAWATTLREADWKFVHRRCAELIASRSKDLQLAVWLAEAGAKTGGLRALGDSLQLIGVLCERYWEDLHPLADDGGYERRIGNLCWIAARIPQLVRECPVTADGRYSMAGWEAARAQGAEALAAAEAARRQGPRAFHEGLLRECDHCAAALSDLERTVDERLGQDGPGFSAARAALQDLIHFVSSGARETGALPPEAPAVAALAPVPAAPPVLAGAVGGAVQGRVQALAQLRAVADYFRRTEPHSPVAYLAEKAAAWGEQPLHVWLRAVVKDDASLARVEELLGVEKGG